MYQPSIDEIKKLREATAASIAYCQQALVEAEGDFDKAKKILELKGMTKAASKSERAVGAGIIDSYIHHNKQLGVLLDIRSETDFVARNQEFISLAHEICLQIAANDPQWVALEDVPAEIIEEKKQLFQRELAKEGKSGKSQEVAEKIVQGKVNSFLEESCLLEQIYLKDNAKKVKDVINLAIGKLGENIKINSFRRLSI